MRSSRQTLATPSYYDQEPYYEEPSQRSKFRAVVSSAKKAWKANRSLIIGFGVALGVMALSAGAATAIYFLWPAAVGAFLGSAVVAGIATAVSAVASWLGFSMAASTAAAVAGAIFLGLNTLVTAALAGTVSGVVAARSAAKKNSYLYEPIVDDDIVKKDYNYQGTTARTTKKTQGNAETLEKGREQLAERAAAESTQQPTQAPQQPAKSDDLAPVYEDRTADSAASASASPSVGQ